MTATTTRKGILTHVLTTLDIPEDVRSYIATQGIVSIGGLTSFKRSELEDLKTESSGVMKLGHCKSLELFTKWIKEYMKDHKNTLPTEWTTEFNENIWENYCLSQESTKDYDDSSHDPSKAMKSIIIHEPSSNVTNIKIDIKSYPLFDGKLTEWKGYKRQL